MSKDVPQVPASKAYLGDGVYVAMLAGFQIQMTTENGVRVTNEIFLEADTLRNLLVWARRQGWDIRQWFPDWDEPGETKVTPL